MTIAFEAEILPAEKACPGCGGSIMLNPRAYCCQCGDPLPLRIRLDPECTGIRPGLLRLIVEEFVDYLQAARMPFRIRRYGERTELGHFIRNSQSFEDFLAGVYDHFSRDQEQFPVATIGELVEELVSQPASFLIELDERAVELKLGWPDEQGLVNWAVYPLGDDRRPIADQSYPDDPFYAGISTILHQWPRAQFPGWQGGKEGDGDYLRAVGQVLWDREGSFPVFGWQQRTYLQTALTVRPHALVGLSD